MRTTFFLVAAAAFLASDSRSTSFAQQPLLPPPDRTPVLVLDHAGPHAPVTAIAFSPDSNILYAGGFDKLVRRYSLKDGKFTSIEPLRVPVGQGIAGAVNAIAVSPDGKWVAVAGRAPLRGEVWSDSQDGIETSARYLPQVLKRDFGIVYLFDATNPQAGRVIRGPESEVRAIAFADPAPADSPVLLTAGSEWDATGKKFGVVRVFDVKSGKELDARRDFPGNTIPPGLAAWTSEQEKKVLHVAVAWPEQAESNRGELIVWDGPESKLKRLPDLAFNFPLSVLRGQDGRAKHIMTGGYDPKIKTSRLAVRSASDIGTETSVPLERSTTQFLLVQAVAALHLPTVGEATAVVVRLSSQQGGVTRRIYELRLLDRTGQSLAKVALADLANDLVPVLTASRDGRFLGVCGFTDHRIEIYDAVTLAGGKLAVQKLPGAPASLPKVSFLAGNKLWLGNATDTPARGGVSFDFATRIASTNDGKAARDSAPDPTFEVTASNEQIGTPVKVTVLGFPAISLREGEQPTSVALLPAKPAWNPALPEVIAIAHRHDESELCQVSLFDAASGKRLLQLGGPTLPVRSLSFSTTRPLLAAAGADHTVSIWSLQNLKSDLAAIEGLTVISRDATTVEIVAIEPQSPARDKLAVGDLVEAAGAMKGQLKAIKTPLDFVKVIRESRVGDTARLQVSRGKKSIVVEVPVGTVVGHRHPLITMWVDPIAKNGVHDWIGWTPAGPYDTNSLAAEGRIGWLTATGNPARPAIYAAANQYRKLYYKKDFLRYLADKAEFGPANDQYLRDNPPQIPKLDVNLTGAVVKFGLKHLVRDKSFSLDVSLADPSESLVLDGAVLRWRAISPLGKIDDWKESSFETGRALIDLSKYPWIRGDHRFEFQLRAPYDGQSVLGATTILYAPPAPVLTLQIDGKGVAAGDEIATKNANIALSAAVNSLVEGAVAVSVTSSAPGSDKPVSLTEKQAGQFSSVNVTINPLAKTTVRVTATAQGDRVDSSLESHTIEFTVRQLPPDEVPPPKVRIELSTPHDPPTEVNGPFLVDLPKASIRATVKDSNAIERFEWDLGDGKGWVEGKLDPKTGTASQEIELPTGATVLTLRARAKSKNSKFADDSLRAVFASLPDVSLVPPVAIVSESRLDIGGSYDLASKVPFTLSVVVGSTSTGQSQEFAVEVDPAARTWRSTVSLAPGENYLGFVIKNQWREKRKANFASIRYFRPPAILSAPVVDAGVNSVADVLVIVANVHGARPVELRVNDRPVGFQLHGKPCGLFGIMLQTLKAEGVPVKSGSTRVKSLAVQVRNSEGVSGVVSTEVRGKDPEPAKPPRISVSQGPNSISSTQIIATDQRRFEVDLLATSEIAFTRAELWHGAGPDSKMQSIAAVSRDKSAKIAGGFELRLRPAIDLRPGVNRFRIVVANSTDATEMEFFVRFNPPAARVVIDSVSEIGANGQPVRLKWSANSDSVVAGGPFIELRGRVVWDADDDPVARDPNLSVVVLANEVMHKQRPTEPSAPDKRERAFVAPVYLNAAETAVQVELRSGYKPGALPQQGKKQTRLMIRTEKPLQAQRLHLIVVGVEVAERDRLALVKRVVEAVGGSMPADRPGFDRGQFKHPAFTRSVLYRPLVSDVERSDILGLLKDVQREIEQVTSRKGEEWVNDVILIYYQGWDLEGKDGVRQLHTSLSLLYKNSSAPRDAVRIDELPPTPGFRFAVLNVEDLGKPRTADPLAAALPQLRYPWKSASATNQLLPMYQAAVANGRTLGDVVTWVRQEVDKNPALFGIPTDGLPPTVRGRWMGLQAP